MKNQKLLWLGAVLGALLLACIGWSVATQNFNPNQFLAVYPNVSIISGGSFTNMNVYAVGLGYGEVLYGNLRINNSGGFQQILLDNAGNAIFNVVSNAALAGVPGVVTNDINGREGSSATLPASMSEALTGDVTKPSGSSATTIATVNANVGSFTSANITVNAKGQVTAAANGSGGGGVTGTTNVNFYNTFAGATFFKITNGINLMVINNSYVDVDTNLTVEGDVTVGTLHATNAGASYFNSSVTFSNAANTNATFGGSGYAINYSDTNGALLSAPYSMIFYASTNGSTANNGLTTNSPWPLGYAITNSGPSNVVVVMDGSYPPASTIYARYPGQVIVAQHKYGAIFNGWTATAFDTFPSVSHNVVFDGLYFTNCQFHGIVIRQGISNFVVRNCWANYIGRYGWANSQSSSGFETLSVFSGLFDSCIAENCGNESSFDHGFYAGGTNVTFRNCVARWNSGYGFQLQNDTIHDALQNIRLENCLSYGNTNGAIVAYNNAGSGGTVTVIGCTLQQGQTQGTGLGGYWFDNQSTAAITLTNCALASTNNAGYGNNNGGSVTEDYNLVSHATAFNGSHDVVNAAQGFVNTNVGNYFLLANSPARGIALATACSTNDLYNILQVSVNDVGFAQYNSTKSGSTYIYDPSQPLTGPEYWRRPPESVTNYQGTFIGTLIQSGGALDYSTLSNAPAHSVLVRNAGTAGNISAEVPGVTAGTYTKLTVDAQGLATVGASAVLASADYANQGTTTTLLHGNAAGNPSFGQVVSADISPGISPFLNGANTTNLVYQYDTNAIPSTGTLTFGHAYSTNLQANVTMPVFTLSGAFFETIAIQLTNSTGTDTKMTMPAGVRGSWGSGTPAVFWCSNKLSATLYIQHYGTQETNAWINNWGP